MKTVKPTLQDATEDSAASAFVQPQQTAAGQTTDTTDKQNDGDYTMDPYEADALLAAIEYYQNGGKTYSWEEALDIIRQPLEDA
jgi:hypothetical protein